MICTLRVKNRYVIRRKSKKTCICMKNLARFAEHPTSKDNIKRLIWQAPRHLKFHILLRQMTLVLIYGVFQFNEANVKALEIHSGLFKSLLLTTLSSLIWFHYGLFLTARFLSWSIGIIFCCWPASCSYRMSLFYRMNLSFKMNLSYMMNLSYRMSL